MHTIEIDDARQAQRCRYAQYSGRLSTFTIAEATITGTVVSVMEDPSASAARWIVKIAQPQKRTSSQGLIARSR